MVEEISSGPISFSSAFTSMGIHDYLFDQLGKRASKHEHSIYLLFLIDRRLKRRHSLLFRVYSRNPFFSKNSSLYFLQKNLLLRGIVFWKILQFPKVKSISRSRIVKDPSLEQIFSTDPVYTRPQ